MPPGEVGVDEGNMHALGGVVGMPEATSCFLTELHEKPGQNAWIIGLLLERIGVAKAFAGKIDSVDLVAPKPQIPVIAVDAPEDLVFEKGEGSVIELHGREYAV